MFINISKSNPSKTPFAPKWLYQVYNSTINNINFDIISNAIIELEPEILKLPAVNKSSSDGNTGLGNSSLTARYTRYNILKYTKYDEIVKLNSSIHYHYLYFLNELNIPRTKVWIQCWANILRHGQKMNTHVHNYNEYSYLSGNITVKCNNTSTIYVHPFDQTNLNSNFEIKNNVGNITIFPQYIPHYTTEHSGPDPRISIAFDLAIDEYYQKMSKENQVPFILFDNL